MMSNEIEVIGTANRDGDQYEEFSEGLRKNFEYAVSTDGGKLFTTDATGLFDAFLAALPDEARQHYTCHACKRFVESFGGLVTINENGEKFSALWMGNIPKFFQSSVVAAVRIVTKSNITGVFLSKDAVLGQPEAGGWHHMSVTSPNNLVFRDRLKTPFQAMAEKLEDYKILRRSLGEFSVGAVREALRLLKSEALYRSERVLGVAEWFYGIQTNIVSLENVRLKDNLIWRAVASAPVGFCHIRNSMIGTLLEDIEAGMSFEVVSRRFSEKMSPTQYQRAQVAPTVSVVEQAAKIVQKLGLENSLQRRYLAFDEIPAFVWKRRDIIAKAPTGGIFANVPTKNQVAPPSPMELPVTTMTWEKFQRTVLPTASKIEIKAEQSSRFAALVTALHPESESVLQWDNGVSWYYHGGADAEMKRRVVAAGGQYEDNEIRCTLMWNTYSDLDIHVNAPSDGHIYFGKKQGIHGYLDVDMNVSPDTDEPVENIRWKRAPSGDYKFYVHNYTDRNQLHNPYRVELEIAGQIHTFDGVIGREGSQIEIASFRYERGVAPVIRGSSSTTNGTAWNLEMGKFYPVSGIVKSPNLWGVNPVEHAGDHTFFLIEGCQDTDQGKGRGFFSEMLKPELREIRRTLEAYTASTPIEGENGVCGLGFSKSGEWGVTVRVMTDSGPATYKIDRWD